MIIIACSLGVSRFDIYAWGISLSRSPLPMDSRGLKDAMAEFKYFTMEAKKKINDGNITFTKDGKEVANMSNKEREKLNNLSEQIETIFKNWRNLQKQINSQYLNSLLVEESKALFEAGEYSKALAQAEKAYAINPVDYKTLNQLGVCLWVNGVFLQAERKLRDALDLAKTDVDKAEGLNDLAVALMSQKKYDEAEKLLREALEICRNLYKKNPEHIATCLNNLARALEHQNKYSEALVLYNESLTIRLSIHSSDHLLVANSYNNKGVLLKKLGDYKQAQDLFQKALKITYYRLGPDHPYTIQTQSNLDKIREQMNN